jgi:glycosidase
MSIYTDNGYESRKDYLNNLADDFGIDRNTVYSIASMLGSSEDFDGLITALEDYAEENY